MTTTELDAYFLVQIEWRIAEVRALLWAGEGQKSLVSVMNDPNGTVVRWQKPMREAE